MKANTFSKPEGKEHLDKDFLEELKHKIWSTKGTRFTADTRLKSTSKLSDFCVSILSVYLIVFGLLTVYKIYNPGETNSDNILAFSITATSIVLLVFTLYENSQNYQSRAKNYHDCALELADLYNELQLFKSYKKNATDEEKMEFTKDIQHRYQQVLKRYDNHAKIDNLKFKTEHRDYYKNLRWYKSLYIKVLFFMHTKFIYLAALIIPGIVLVRIINGGF